MDWSEWMEDWKIEEEHRIVALATGFSAAVHVWWIARAFGWAGDLWMVAAISVALAGLVSFGVTLSFIRAHRNIALVSTCRNESGEPQVFVLPAIAAHHYKRVSVGSGLVHVPIVQIWQATQAQWLLFCALNPVAYSCALLADFTLNPLCLFPVYLLAPLLWWLRGAYMRREASLTEAEASLQTLVSLNHKLS